MLDPARIIPLRVSVDQPVRRGQRVVAGLIETAVALLCNAIVVAALVHWAFPRDLAQPRQQTIAVDIINETPKGTGLDGKGAATPDKAGDSHGSTPMPPRDAKPAVTAAMPVTPAPPPPPPAAAPEASPPPERPSAPQPSLTLDPTQQPKIPAATPPPVGSSDDAQPHLVEAPADPREAARQSDKNVAANAVVARPDVDKPPAPASPEQYLLSNAAGDDTVPEPSTADQPATDQAVAAPETKQQAENTAKLAAALPFSQTFAAVPPHAAVSGSGSTTSEQYRGAVYGAFQKADDVVEAARAKHLRGQAVVAFSVDDAGALKSVVVAVSSGNPEIDAAALALIRRAAPFPPPPPGAQHAFSPAIGFGLDDP